MRNAFCAAIERAPRRTSHRLLHRGPRLHGAGAPARAAWASRFINAGIAEQNMVSVAAGVASLGEQCWAYSIAPFVFGRPFEQVRNDVCLHDFRREARRQWRRLRLRRDGRQPPCAGRLWRAPRPCRTCAPTFRPSPRTSPRSPGAWRPIAHPGYLRLGRCEKPGGNFVAARPTRPGAACLPGEAGVLIVVGPNAGGLSWRKRSPVAGARMRPEVWAWCPNFRLRWRPCRTRAGPASSLAVRSTSWKSMWRREASATCSPPIFSSTGIKAPGVFRHFCRPRLPLWTLRVASLSTGARCGLDAPSRPRRNPGRAELPLTHDSTLFEARE